MEKTIDESSKIIKDELKKEIEERPDWIEKDAVRETLSELLEGKIGVSYKEEELNDIYEECQKRYDLEIPPGYEDAKKKDGLSRYGDAILWLQLIDFAKEKRLPVIFITREDKTDWWNPEKELEKDRQPNYDLIKEFNSKTGNPFFIYTTDRFLFWAGKYLGTKVSPETIEEIKQIGEFGKISDFILPISAYTLPISHYRPKKYTLVHESLDSEDDEKAAQIRDEFECESESMG